MGTHKVQGVLNYSCFSGEGEYVIPTTTVFGLEDSEIKDLQKEGLKVRTVKLKQQKNNVLTAKSICYQLSFITMHYCSEYFIHG